MVSSTTPRFGPEMAADGTGVILGEDVDEFFAHLLGEEGQVLLIEFLDVGGRIDLVEKTHGLNFLKKTHWVRGAFGATRILLRIRSFRRRRGLDFAGVLNRCKALGPGRRRRG